MPCPARVLVVNLDYWYTSTFIHTTVLHSVKVKVPSVLVNAAVLYIVCVFFRMCVRVDAWYDRGVTLVYRSLANIFLTDYYECLLVVAIRRLLK